MHPETNFKFPYYAAAESQKLETTHYWGTRQQLRAGKVIADWIDRRKGSLDLIFGVLLCPTAGRLNYY